jgi:hypothetical protein
MTGLEFLATSLRESGLEVDEYPEHGAVGFEHLGRNGDWEVFCRSRDPVSQVAVYSILSVAVPADRRARVAELLTRANYGLIIGNFELDLDDGELRFKTSIDFAGDRLSGALLAMLIEHNLDAFDRYLPAINGAMTTDRPVLELLQTVEGELA